MRKHSRERTSAAKSPFDSLGPRVRQWIDYEQTVNDRFFNDKAILAFDERSNTVRRKFYPEQRPVWEQELVWLPNKVVRRYGLVDEAVQAWPGFDHGEIALPFFFIRKHQHRIAVWPSNMAARRSPILA